MSTPLARLRDEPYVNWCRGSLALFFLKECLEEFTEKRVSDFHDELHKIVPQPYSRHGPSKHHRSSSIQVCTSCTYSSVQKSNQTWVVNCPSGACSSWIEHIANYHVDNSTPTIERTNLKPQLWPSHPWEVAKFFLPYGCGDVKSAKEADVAAILKLLLSCLFMSRFINDHTLIEKVIDIRNRLMHSNDLSVTDDQLQEDIDTIIKLLKALVDLSSTETETVQKTIDNVQKLQSKVLDVTLNREVIALNSRMQAIDKRLACLENKCSDYVNTRQKLEQTASDLEALDEEYRNSQFEMNQLKTTSKRFDEFLQNNNYMRDIATLSTRLGELDVNFERRIHKLEEELKFQSKADVPDDDRRRKWEKQCHDAQHYLVNLYGKICLWENPMTSDKEQIPNMYVQPIAKLITVKGEGLAEVYERQSQPSSITCKMLFHSNTGPCENVYMTGDAGAGKTAFCYHMVLNWCKAVQNIQDENVASEDLKFLSDFKFLFYINLRDTEEIYHIEDMIKEQLLCNTSTPLDVSNVLKTEKCLIVLDGLDEWSCPAGTKTCPGLNKEIPGRNITSEQCVFLTTTRGWKFDIIDLQTNEVDKHVELCGIDEDTSRKLAQNMCDYLNRKSSREKYIDTFYTDLDKKNIDSLLTVPILLIQLITLWHFGKEFGKSQLQIYCSMLDFLFDKNLPKKPLKGISKPEASTGELPSCFSGKDNCQNHAKLLRCLAKLAYDTLFNNQRENALVFKSSKLIFDKNIFDISSSDVNLCLHSGVLSQNKDYSNYTGHYKKFSFLHKKFQEFLAAVYIVTCEPIDDILEDLKLFCNSVDIMLEMAQVWLFVSGIRLDITEKLLTHLSHVSISDKQIQNYRQTLGGYGLIQKIQSCVTDCFTEGNNNGIAYNNIYLEDFYVTNTTVYCIEPVLLSAKSSDIKSVYIDTFDMDRDKLTSITGHLQECRVVQKIHFDNPGSNLSSQTVGSIAKIVDNACNTITCLQLFNITATEELYTAICDTCIKSLMALELFDVKLTHDNIKELFNSLVDSSTIREIQLYTRCTEHNGCSARIDFSTMTKRLDMRIMSG